MRYTSRTSPFGVAIVVSLIGSSLAVLPARAADAAKKNPTFAKDVAPIFQQKCQVCHHPGTVAPMSLMTFEDTRPWARSIKKRVAAGEMPPWHLDKKVGIQKFKNDRSLTDEQIATIVNWVDTGAPLGDPKDLPPPLTFTDDDQWFIGKPDLIVTMPKDHVMYANGPDWWINYVAETGLGEDRYFKAIETRVTKDGRRIVHHAVTGLIRDADSAQARPPGRRGPVLDPAEGSYLNEYALGKTGEIFPEGTGRILTAKSKINFSMHYHAVGEEIRDRTSVGFVLYPKGYVPKHHITDLTLDEIETIDIAPNSMARSELFYPLPKPARIVSFQPHMHMRGKAMCLEAIYTTGNRETINCADRFDFNWHIMYHYEDDVAPLLPAGTILHIVGVHDNTAANPRNPDPTVWVGWGQRSVDEMMAAHMGFEFMTDEDYKEAVAERKRKLSKSQ